MTSVSFLYCCHNRAHLFAKTLEAFASWPTEAFLWEIIVVDDRSEDDLVRVAAKFAENLPISYFRADPRVVFPSCYVVNSAINPAYVQNVGLRAAKGEKIVFSSPEIAPTSENWVEFLAKTPFFEKICLIGDVKDDFYGFLSGGPEKRRLPFLAAFPTEPLRALGGVDERFLDGFAFEDNSLEWRWLWSGGTYDFAGPEWSGYHQPHDRHDGSAQVGFERNHRLWMQELYPAEEPIVNQGRHWGDPAGISSRWESWCWRERWDGVE